MISSVYFLEYFQTTKRNWIASQIIKSFIQATSWAALSASLRSVSIGGSARHVALSAGATSTLVGVES
jgi:hypothetical protein